MNRKPKTPSEMRVYLKEIEEKMISGRDEKHTHTCQECVKCWSCHAGKECKAPPRDGFCKTHRLKTRRAD